MAHMTGKYNMRSMGEKFEEMACPSPKGMESKEHFPEFSISGKQIPEVKDLKIGQEIVFHATGKVVSIRADRERGVQASIEIREADIHAGKEASDKRIIVGKRVVGMKEEEE